MKDMRFKVKDMRLDYPAMLRLTLTPKQSLELALDLLKFVQAAKVDSASERVQEFPLFGNFEELGPDGRPAD